MGQMNHLTNVCDFLAKLILTKSFFYVLYRQQLATKVRFHALGAKRISPYVKAYTSSRGKFRCIKLEK